MTRRFVRCAECNASIPKRELARLAERLIDAGFVEERVLCDGCCGRLLRREGIRMATDECQRDYQAEREEAVALVRAAERNLDDVRARCQRAIQDAESWLTEARRRLRIVQRVDLNRRSIVSIPRGIGTKDMEVWFNPTPRPPPPPLGPTNVAPPERALGT